jgi:hypothetical protein
LFNQDDSSLNISSNLFNIVMKSRVVRVKKIMTCTIGKFAFHPEVLLAIMLFGTRTTRDFITMLKRFDEMLRELSS